MAQVRKFNTGGAAPKDLFNIGNRLIDKDDLVYLAKKNLSVFLSNNGIEGELATLVKNSFNNIISKIDNKEITSIGEDGALVDPSGTLTNTSEGFDANGSVVTYLNQLANRISTYKAAAKTKYTDKKSRLWEIFTNDFYGGNFSGSASDLKLWTSQDDLGTKFASYLDKYKTEIENSDYDWEGSDTTKDEILQKIDKASTNLKNGTVDDSDVIDLVRLGIPSAQAYAVLGLQTPEEKQAADEAAAKQAAENPTFDLTRQSAIDTKKAELLKVGYTEEEALLKATELVDASIKANKDLVDAQLEGLEIDNELTQGTAKYGGDSTYNILQVGEGYHDEWYENDTNLGLLVKSIYNMLDNTSGNKYKTLVQYFDSLPKGSGQRRRALAALRSAISNDTENLVTVELKDGTYLLKRFVNGATNTAWIFDPKKNVLKRVKISSSDEIKSYYKEVRKTQKKEQGGILFAGLGDELYAQWQAKNTQYLKEKQAIEKKKEELLATESGKSVEQYKHDSKKISSIKDFTKSDITRMVAAVADLTGAVAAFIPGGSIYSFVQGLGSDIARTGADISDGMSWGSALWGLAKGAGMTILTSIPVVGTEGKLAKAFNGLKAFLPWMFTLGATYNTFEPAKKSFENINNGKGTAEDYKNILQFATAFLNTTKLAGNSWKANAIKKAANTGDTETVLQGKNGNIKVSKSELETLKSATSKADMQAKLKAMPGHENDELDFSIANGLNPFSSSLKATGKSWYNKGVSVSENPIYNWNNIKGKYVSDVKFMTEGMGVFMPLKLATWWENLQMPGFNPYNPGKTTPTTETTVRPTSTVDEDDILAGTVGALKHGGKLQFVLEMHRKGGIIKAVHGSLLTLSPYTYSIDNDANWDYSTLYGVHSTNGTLGYGDAWGNTGASTADKENRYLAQSTPGIDEGKVLERYDYYTKFTEALKKSAKEYNESNKDTNLFYQWAKKVDETLPSGSLSTFFDKDGKLRSSWTSKVNDTYKRKPETYKTIEEYIDHIRNDQQFANRHNDFKKTGDKYYYLDDNGQKVWVKPGDYISTYDVSDEGSEEEGNTTWNIHQLKAKGTNTGNNSYVNPVTFNGEKNPIQYNPYETLGKLGSLGKYIYTKLTNQEMTDEALKKQIAAYKIPKHEEAPIVNVYNLEANKQRQEGQLDSTAKDILNSTSDQLVGINARLKASKNKAEVAQKYDSAIDEKIENNKKEQVTVANNNNAYQTDVANYNGQVMVSKHDADIDVINGQKSADLTSSQNLIDEQIQDWKTKGQEWESTVTSNVEKTQQAIMLYKLSNDNDYLQAKANYQTAYDNKDYTTAQKYLAEMNSIMTKYETEYYNNVMSQIAQLKGIKWNNIPIYQDYSLTTPQVKKDKNGGTLEDNRFKARLKDNERLEKNALKMIEINRKAIENSSAITKAIIIKFIK